MLSLRPSQQRGVRETSSSASHVWSEISVTSCGADCKWSEHCRGLIAVRSVNQDNSSNNEFSGSRLAELEKGQKNDLWRIMRKHLYGRHRSYRVIRSFDCNWTAVWTFFPEFNTSPSQ